MVQQYLTKSERKTNSKTLSLLSLLFFFILTTIGANAQTTVNITTTGAGTWTVPCGVTSITVEAWGGGGAGGGATANGVDGGAGGAGGTYVSSTLAVTSGTTYNLFVGNGANGGTTGGNTGQASWFNTTGTLYAQGGAGGQAPNGGTATGGVGSIATSIGTTRIAGTNGSNGTPTVGGAGGAGGNAGGAGGIQRTTENNGANGSAPGGGGGGAFIPDNTNHNGGSGARGEIRITYTDPFPTYCSPTFTSGVIPITNVTFAGINNNSSNATFGTNYLESNCDTGNVMQGSTYPISVTGATYGGYTFYERVYIDWDQDGTFGNNPDEIYGLGSISLTDPATITGNIAVPATAALGQTRMRVIQNYNAYDAGPCRTGTGNGQAEDYTINVTAPPACTAPSAQPTALNLTPTGTTISGSFTAASPAPDSYLVVFNTTGTTPNPVDFTSYNIGNSINGSIVADNDSDTTFTIGGLNTNTTYYVFVFSFNGLCTGGPLYYTPSPLNGNATTTAVAPSYCTPSTTNDITTRYIDDVSFLGTLNDVDNFNSGTNAATPGYQDFTGLTNSIQAQGEGVNVYVESNSRGRWIAWVDWNKDGDFMDANEQVYDSNAATLTTTFGFIVPTTTLPGDYRMRVRIYNSFYTVGPPGPPTTYESFGYDFDSCETFDTNIVSGYTAYEYGEAEDYLFTVISSCGANITSVTDGLICGTGTVDLSVTGTSGVTEYRWYANEFGGTPIATTATGDWTTPSLSATTSYWVTAYNGSCESLVRTEVVAKLNPIANLTFTPSTPEICGEDNVISISATGDVETVYLIDEDFESGGLGVFTNTHLVSNPAVDAQTAWQNETSTYIPGGLTWYPAISSNFGTNHFAFVTSDVGTYVVDNVLTSPTVDSTNFTDLTLTFRMYYSRYFPDGNATYDTTEYMQVQVSTNGGGAWTTIGGNIITDQGIGTRFADLSYDLNAYINEPNLRIRIRYYVGTWCDGAAVDDIQLFGSTPLNTSFDWTSALPVDAYQDLACTIPYTTGTPAVTVYIKPTLAQLEQGTYSFTASAILSNGCSISDIVSINNKSKVWKGGNSNDWNDPNNWSPVGVPDITNCVIIPDVTATNYSNIGGVNYDAFGKTLQVLDNGELQLRSGNTLTIEDFVEVEPAGIFHIENSGSLIQINNVANTGSLTMDRDAVTNNILDYVYWSTPVDGFVVDNITPSSSYVYQWEPTVATAYAGDFGIWTAASGAMTTGRGYIIRGSSGISTFDGVPNNGDITTPISRSTYQGGTYAGPTATLVTEDDDNWNLLGNPYPSALSADDFLTVNNTHLEQFVKIWTHGIDPAAIADPFYQDFLFNYDVADYITYNALGGTQSGFDGYIGAGQGFFVLMTDAASTSENVTFNNSMRSNTYRNDQFYRTSNEVEKHRIWLKLVSPTGSSSDALVGYVTDASDDLDAKYDAISAREKATFELYSVIKDDSYAIQGRSLPFNDSDLVPLGVVVPQNGIYTIAINNTDGLFSEDQNIYLEDLELGIVYDLKAAPYTFMANSGRYNNRFVLRYTNESSKANSFEDNSVFVYTNELININSQNVKLKEVTVYDLLGRNLYSNSNVNQTEISIQQISPTQSGLIINVTLVNGQTKTFKVIY